MKKKLLIGLVAATTVGGGSLLYTLLPTHLQCTLTGRKWRMIPSAADQSPFQCYRPPRDEGKMCYQNSDCVKDCIHWNETDDDGYLVGVCGEYSAFVCAPTIPEKTKILKDRVGGSCV